MFYDPHTRPEILDECVRHSRHLLDVLHHEAQIIWMKDGRAERSDEVDFVSVLLDLGALDEADKLKNGHYDCLLLTEDRNKRKLKTLLAANGFDMCRTLVWWYGSSTQLDAAKLVARFVREYAMGTQVAVHRDRDYLTDDEAANEAARFEKGGIPFFLTRDVDIESHLLDPDYLAAWNPQKGRDGWQEALHTVTEEKKETSISKFVGSPRFAKRRAKKDKADDDALRAECAAAYERAPMRYRHGKSVWDALNTAHHKKTGSKLVFGPSAHLRNATLEEIAARIPWKGLRK